MARIRLEGFVLDTEARQLTRGGCPVTLAPKVLELLSLLVERRPGAVAKAAIHRHQGECSRAAICIPLL